MSNQQIESLEQRLAEMQRELEKLKNADGGGETAEKADNLTKYAGEIEKAAGAAAEILTAITADGCQAACLSVGSLRYSGTTGTGTSISCIDTLDEISEDGIAAALDVFTNPRRIAILKLLANRIMSASEISQNTGLVGGQLHHHLTCLENAKLINKQDGKYSAPASTLLLLCALQTAIGGMEIAKVPAE